MQTKAPTVCPEVTLAMLNFDCQPKTPVLRVEAGFYFYCHNPEGLFYIIIKSLTRVTLNLNDLFRVCMKPDKYNLLLSTAHKSFFFRERGLSSSFCLCLFCSTLHTTHPALPSFPFQNVNRNDHEREGMVSFIFCISSLLKNQKHPDTPTHPHLSNSTFMSASPAECVP